MLPQKYSSAGFLVRYPAIHPYSECVLWARKALARQSLALGWSSFLCFLLFSSKI